MRLPPAFCALLLLVGSALDRPLRLDKVFPYFAWSAWARCWNALGRVGCLSQTAGGHAEELLCVGCAAALSVPSYTAPVFVALVAKEFDRALDIHMSPDSRLRIPDAFIAASRLCNVEVDLDRDVVPAPFVAVLFLVAHCAQVEPWPNVADIQSFLWTVYLNTARKCSPKRFMAVAAAGRACKSA